ncbi:hypothetical protein [Gracilimonas sp.]|uniref:hypothetical protein n=1 Tax=Gracilimonas sp. TaxID=1974203 RepID=UPI0032EB1B1E
MENRLKISCTILMIVFVLFNFSYAKAQLNCDNQITNGNPKTVKLNFNDRIINGRESLKGMEAGSFYRILVSDINMNLYKVNINNKDTSSTSSGKLLSLGIDSLLKKIQLPNLITVLPLPDISKELAEEMFQAKNLEKNQNITEAIELYTNVQQKLTGILADAEETLIEISNQYVSYQVQDQTTGTYTYLTSGFDFEESFKKLDELRRTLNQVKIDINRLAEILSYLSIYKDEMGNSYQELSDNFSKLKSYSDTISKIISIDKITELKTRIMHRENNKANCYLSLPYEIKQGNNTVKVYIEPKSIESGLPSFNTNFSFSSKPSPFVGVGAGFYWTNMYNSEYAVSSSPIDSNTTEYRIIEEDNDQFEIGVASMVHFSAGEPNNNLHFTIGTAFPLNDLDRLRLLAGGGIRFGPKDMITANIMAVAGMVNELSNAHSINNTTTIEPVNITRSKLKVGISISIGYLYKF